jgi:peptidoglycan hydrolase CwlO-like protein
MNQTEKTRLDRIEEKIDKLADAVVSIARAEEKIHSLDEKVITIWSSMDDLHGKFDSLEERLREVESVTDDAKNKLQFISTLFWTIIAAAAAGIASAYAWFGGGSGQQ